MIVLVELLSIILVGRSGGGSSSIGSGGSGSSGNSRDISSGG